MLARLFNNPYLLLAVAGLCWSGNHVIGRAIAGQVPPMSLSAVRWLLPMAVLWPFAKPRLEHDWPLIKANWRVLLFLGGTGGALFGALQYFALQHTTALNASVLNSLSPVLIIAAGALLFHDRLSPARVLGIATSLVGVLVVVSRLDLAILSTLSLSLGDLMITFNMAVWGIYSACLRLRPKIHWLSFIYIVAAIATVGTMPLLVWEQWSGFTFPPTLMTVSAILYVSFFPSLVAFVCWNRGVELIGPNRASPFLHLVVLYSAILATVFLGERIMPYHVLGFILILGGVALAARRMR
jgi:drug/metabolite transporter (DMT)-like permease